MAAVLWLVANDFDSAGGAETVFMEEVRALSEHGKIEVVPVTFSSLHRPSRLLHYGTTLVRLAYRAVLRKRTIVHVHNFTTFGGLMFLVHIAALRKLGKIRCLHTAHDYYLLLPTRNGLAYSNQNRLLNIYESSCNRVKYGTTRISHALRYFRHKAVSRFVRSVRPFDYITAPSAHLAHQLRHALSMRTCTLRNPIGTMPRDVRVGPDSRRCFIIGRLREDKGVLESIQYWVDCLPNTSLEVIGKGPLEAAATALIGGLPASRRESVKFSGWISKQEVLTKIQGGRVIFGSKWTENAPMVFLESYFAGVQVVLLESNKCTREFSKIMGNIFLHVTPPSYTSRTFSTAAIVKMFSNARFVKKLLQLGLAEQ